MQDCFETAHATPVCPACHSKHRQTRAGRTATGTQRYQCQDCKRHYCAENRRYRYPLALRQQATCLYQSGVSLRQISRMFSVNHQTVVNWVRADAEQSVPLRQAGGGSAYAAQPSPNPSSQNLSSQNLSSQNPSSHNAEA